MTQAGALSTTAAEGWLRSIPGLTLARLHWTGAVCRCTPFSPGAARRLLKSSVADPAGSVAALIVQFLRTHTQHWPFARQIGRHRQSNNERQLGPDNEAAFLLISQDWFPCCRADTISLMDNHGKQSVMS